MAAYTTRIVLFDAEWSDYEKLYEYMEEEGFSKTIVSDDGIEYDLPDAEYNYQGKAIRAEVLVKAKSAAGRTGKKFSALVTESNGRTWHALKKTSR